MVIRIVIILCIISCQSFGQINNGAYNLLLKTLLSHSVTEVSVMEVKAMKEIVLLDARELKEFKVSHLPGAQFVGFDTFEKESLKSISKNKKIVIYCSMGYRSEKIAEKIKAEGFTDVSNLYGGIFEWVNQGNPVVDSTNQPTDRVHAYTKTWGIWLTQGEKIYDNK